MRYRFQHDYVEGRPTLVLEMPATEFFKSLTWTFQGDSKSFGVFCSGGLVMSADDGCLNEVADSLDLVFVDDEAFFNIESDAMVAIPSSYYISVEAKRDREA